MERAASRIAATLITAALGAVVASGETVPPSIVGHLQSGGFIPGELVIQAEARATRIFKAIGVSLRWANDDNGRARLSDHDNVFDVWVTVLSAEATDSFLAKTSIPHDALGVTMVRTTQVYVFGQRIRDAARSRQYLPALFGRVLAHEVGHVVLPAEGHSDVGIMRADLSKAAPIIDPGFTDFQGASIRRWLTSGRMLDPSGNGPELSALDTH